MYPNPNPLGKKTTSFSTSIHNSFQYQSESNDNIINTDGNANYGGVTSWPTVPPLPPPTSGLIRQSSSPAAFYHQHLFSDLGISNTNEGGSESYNHPQAQASSRNKNMQSRLSSDQLIFAKPNSNVNDVNYRPSSLKKASTSSTSSSSRRFTLGPWEECNNSIRFDATYDSQVHNLEMGTTSNLNEEDTVAWRIRAKRGFATDPRSIAERERRTKINCKLKTLQELLPNIDKQASYADMLDLAVEHVKGLQSQIQVLNEELNNCRCGCINHNHNHNQ
ncbi:hypothetical protein V2J09_017471 [Rumex salicifolius]